MSAYDFLLGGAGGQGLYQLGVMGNRHGLVTGATGTGKTVTLQVLAESYARMGVPVFAADIKGDLSGVAVAGTPHAKIDERLAVMPTQDFSFQGCPVVFWDVFGQSGHPLRSTISEMGPLLLSSLLGVNETQSGILYACFRIADEQGLLLLDLKDLRAMLEFMAGNAAELRGTYGNISAASVGALQRQLLVLEEQGGDIFFGEPAVNLGDLMHVDFSGNGVISILDASSLMSRSPKIYATFLLWLLAELFEQLPEVGNPDKPVMVFFFDEAHLLFDNAPKALVDKIEQVVRLIRSKGVGIYFITQSPTDVPDQILGQLGLKIQHALRAYTPREQKAVRAVAESFRANPAFDTGEAIVSLGTGEALVSALDEKGRPRMVERILIRPPYSRIGPLTEQERATMLSRSPLKGRYDAAVDRESAFELLQVRASESMARAEEARQAETQARSKGTDSGWFSGSGRRQGVAEALVKSTVRTIGTQLGREILRGVLGSLFGRKR
ncbi:MAG: ATP-binding protein [Deltaproteobacteria bacterium HGW-Deltaproteobacteria-18]|nr:MAG: ATP-binding protein [Deltaproteobacteria bacterium HGW-Deltaproteobacteria-18]